MRPNLLFLLPNIFTASSLFFGFLSIVLASKGEFEKAIWYILIALIFDGLDGRVARLTNTTSKFGMEFDSLSDLVAFGVAPAMILYFYVGINFGKVGVAISALFVLFGAIRLARFNTATFLEPNVFIGFPIPAAALLVSFSILNSINQNLPITPKSLLVLAIIVGVVMVSNIRYPNFKKLSITPQNRIKFLILSILILIALYIAPEIGIFLLFFGYFLFGIIRATYFILTKKVLKSRD